jgi:hypothetical protein
MSSGPIGAADLARGRSRARVFTSKTLRDGVYQRMLDRIDCGPFDGGCLVFAQALQRVNGGHLFVVEGRCFSGWAGFGKPLYQGAMLARHAVLALKDGDFMDALGRCEERTMLRRTARLARFVASAESLRPLREGDLPDAARDEDLVDRLSTVLALAARAPGRSHTKAPAVRVY